MKKKSKNKIQLLTVFAVIIAGILFAQWKSDSWPFVKQDKWQWIYQEGVISKEHDTNQNPDIIQLPNGCYRLYSHGGWQTGFQNIYSYYSCDGESWQFEGKTIDKGAMPAAIITPDGKTRIYFQRGIDRDEKQALMTAISNDGLNFSNERQLLVTKVGEFAEIKSFAHLEIVKLEKGYRMYFDESGLYPNDFEQHKNENWGWPVTQIRSLYSEDGLDWKLEQGARIEYEQVPLTQMQRAGSCTVVKDSQKYYMFFNAGFSPLSDNKWWKKLSYGSIYEAISADGLNWEIIDSPILYRGVDPKVIKIGEKYKMYLSEGDTKSGNFVDIYSRTK